MERKVLGRGLSALIPESSTKGGQMIINLDINEIRPNRFQPRQSINQEDLDELIASIRSKGVVQPILVRHSADGYELIAGERRLVASKAVGSDTIPAIIKDVTDTEALEFALIENIQRKNLNAIEEACAYKRLIDEFKLTQEDVSQAVGKDRTTVANILRLLTLPKSIQDYIKTDKLTVGHAKVLLSLTNQQRQLALCETIISKGLSVREAENLVKRFTPKTHTKKTQKGRDSHIVSIEEELQHLFGTRVKITYAHKRGKIEIEFYSPDDFQRLVGILTNKSR